MTAEEYFAWEDARQGCYDFVHGAILPMSGGSFNHALLGANVTRVLGTLLQGKGCFVLSSDQRVELEPDGIYAYPDVTVVCEPPRFRNDDQRTLQNPTVVVEVLSPSTADYDRGIKQRAYRAMPSLRAVIFVSQTACVMDALHRADDGRWYAVDVENGALRLDALGIALSVDAVFEGLDLPDEDPIPDDVRIERKP